MIPVPILLYHSIAPTWSDEYRRWCVHPTVFDAHLGVLDDLGFTPLTVSEFVDAREAGQLPPRPCLLTFDDGRADFVEHALPILQRRSMRSTMYVVTGRIDRTSDWLPMCAEQDQPMMSWDDLRTLQPAGVEVGAHSTSHVELDNVSTAELTAEVSGSRQRLSDELGRQARSFAYPHGYHSRRVIAAVRDAGFDSACAVFDRWSDDADDRFALSRRFIWNRTTPDDLRGWLTTPPTSPVRTTATRQAARLGWRQVRRARHRIRQETRS